MLFGVSSSGFQSDPQDGGKKVLSYFFIFHAKGKFTHNIRSMLQICRSKLGFFFPGCPLDPEDAGKKVLSYFFIMKAKGKFSHNIRSIV